MKKATSTLLILFLVFFQTEADQNFRTARQKQFPFIASISSKQNGRNITCVGSLIDHHWIITTASCVHQQNKVYISLGTTKLNGKQKGEQHLSIDNPKYIFVHEDFNPSTLVNNIALIEVNKKIILNEFVTTTGYNKAESIDPDGYVAGWTFGTNVATQKYDSLLHYEIVETMDYDECASFHKKLINSYCVMPPRTSVCFLDSGTPYFRYDSTAKISKFLLLGIGNDNWLKGQESCGNPPPAFLDVSVYEFWIKKIMSSGSQKSKSN